MEQISNDLTCDRFPPISARYPEDDGLFYYAMHKQLPNDWWRIPQLLGKRIRGCFHGWVIFSNHPINNKWSLWNQATSKIISLPTLILKDGEYTSIGECCLSAPPDHPGSILLLTRTDKSSFVFFRMNNKKRNKLRWIEMSYAYRIKRLTYNGKLVHSPTCCNGKVYALCTDSTYCEFVIHVDIVVKEKEVVIKLMLFSASPYPSWQGYGPEKIVYLKGSSTELFYIRIYVEEAKPISVHIFKSDMTCIDWEEREYLKYWDIGDLIDGKVTNDAEEDLDMSLETWEEIDDLKDTIFFVDLARDHSVSYGRVIASELAGFIHIRGKMDETI